MRAGEAHAAFATLPLTRLHDLPGPLPALVLAPHPDDESLGCGGFIAACCAAGRPPVVVVVTDGAGSHPASLAYPPARLRAVRQAEARAATAQLGLPPGRLHFLGLADTAAPCAGPVFNAAVDELARLAGSTGCGMVVAPWLHDPHCDHEAVQLMARALVRRSGLPLLSYPVWGWTLPPDTVLREPPIRGWRLDIAAHLEAKRQAIAAHASQATDLIDDDPSGFRLPAQLLHIFERPYEVFLETA